MEEEIKLDSYVSYKVANVTLRYIVLFVIVLCLLFSAYIYNMSLNMVQENLKNVYLVDKNTGEIAVGVKTSERETRIYEYNDAIKLTFTYWYAFDEGSYNTNIKKALYLLGGCGEKMLDNYKGMLTKLRDENIKLTVTVDNPFIDMSTKPVSGYVTGIQTISIGEYKTMRKIKVKFIIFDFDRSENNSHGVKIDNWDETFEIIENEK